MLSNGIAPNRTLWTTAGTCFVAGIGLSLAASALSRQPGWATTAAFALVTTPAVALVARGGMARRVRVEPGGVRVRDVGYSRLVHWDDIDAISASPVTGRANLRRYRLHRRRGRAVSFLQDAAGAEQAAAAVTRYLTATRLPALLQQLDRGQPASFGPVVVDGRHVQVGDVRRPFDEVVLVHGPGFLALCERSTGESVTEVDEGRVRNLPLLLRLSAALERRRFESQRPGGP